MVDGAIFCLLLLFITKAMLLTLYNDVLHDQDYQISHYAL